MFPFLCSDHDTASTFTIPDSGLTSKLEYQHHLQYCLFGAMIYMGLKEWKRAQVLLESAIVTPVSNNASKIQVEAYKKWILVNLLRRGRVSTAFVRLCCRPIANGHSLVFTNASYNKSASCKAISCLGQAI